jgi:hypothetical protein
MGRHHVQLRFQQRLPHQVVSGLDLRRENLLLESRLKLNLGRLPRGRRVLAVVTALVLLVPFFLDLDNLLVGEVTALLLQVVWHRLNFKRRVVPVAGRRLIASRNLADESDQLFLFLEVHLVPILQIIS